MMDYAKTANLVIKYVGGKDNIKSVTHCAARLRFQLRDNELRSEEATNDLEGVKGVFLTQSQFQIIFGSGTMNMVCDEVQKQLETLEEKPEEKEEGKGDVVQCFIKMPSSIFVPIIPATMAGDLPMGLNNLLISPLTNGRSIVALYLAWQGLASAINTFVNALSTFLSALISFSATRKFGGNASLDTAIDMTMVHPDLPNTYQIELAQPSVWDIFGFQIAAIGYQGTVLPALAAPWILANIERRLHEVTSSRLDSLTTPLLSILVISFPTFIFVGPVLWEADGLPAASVTWLYDTLGPMDGALFGFTYAPITMTGMHHSFVIVEIQLLADSAHTGGSSIFSTAGMNNVAQGAVVPAVLLMTKNDKMESICSAPDISALSGITEPTMLSVTLKLEYPFYAAMAGSAAGSVYLTATKILAWALGAAGSPGFTSMKPDHYVSFAIGVVLSMGVPFALTMVFWGRFALDQRDGTEERTGSRTGEIGEAPEVEMPRKTVIQLYVPMKGRTLDVGQPADEVFASKAPRSGAAINPAESMVCASCDGITSLLFPTERMVGIIPETGVEVLAHIGINTVWPGGQGFEVSVSQGDKVKKDDKLIAVDLDLIREKGMNLQIMVILPEGGNPDVTVYPSEQADAKIVMIKAMETE